MIIVIEAAKGQLVHKCCCYPFLGTGIACAFHLTMRPRLLITVLKRKVSLKLALDLLQKHNPTWSCCNCFGINTRLVILLLFTDIIIYVVIILFVARVMSMPKLRSPANEG